MSMSVSPKGVEKPLPPRTLFNVIGIIVFVFAIALLAREGAVREFEYYVLHNAPGDTDAIQKRIRFLNGVLAERIVSDRMIARLSSKDSRDQMMALGYVMATRDRRAVPKIIDLIRENKTTGQLRLDAAAILCDVDPESAEQCGAVRIWQDYLRKSREESTPAIR